MNGTLSRPRILLLGGGAVARECFLPALDKLDLLGRTTVVDPRAPTASFEKAERVVRSDFRDFFSGRAVDFSHCVVALPNALHYEAVTKALESGLHVLCEKPLSVHPSDCEALAALAESRQRILAVNMVRRLFQSVRAAATALRRGWVGDVQALRISHGGPYAWPVSSLAPFQREYGGILADMGVHYLDLAEMLLGPLTPVAYEDDCRGGVESECRYELRTASDVPVDITLSWRRPLTNEVVILGHAGRLTLGVDTFDHCVYEPANNQPEEGRLHLGSLDGAAWTFSDYFALQLERFLQSDFQNQSSMVTARSAARIASLIEWATAARPPGRADTPPRADGQTCVSGRVLVTGGTGFIGSHLIGRLASDGVPDIDVLYHSVRSCAGISRYPVSYTTADLLCLDRTREAVRGKRYVFHLAVARDEDSARAVTVDGTRNLVEACILEDVQSIVILSTMYVLGHPGGLVDENSPYAPIGGTYGDAKTEMERWCLARARTSGRTSIVVLLPTCVYGPGGHTYTATPSQLANEGRFCWIDDGCGIANVVYVENLVDAMVRAAINERARGQRFIVNDASLSWREFLTPLLGPAAASVKSRSLEEFRTFASEPPAPGVRDLAASVLRSPEIRDTLARTAVANRIRPLMKKYAPATVARLRHPQPELRTRERRPAVPPLWLADVFGSTTTRYSAARARNVLGWTSAIPMDTALARTVAWLREQGLHVTANG